MFPTNVAALAAVAGLPDKASKKPERQGQIITGDKVVINVDVGRESADQQQLKVSPIALLGKKMDVRCEYVQQITCNKLYICYTMKPGTIRVLNKITVNTTLLRHHQSAVCDMKFFSYDSNLLATITKSGEFIVGEILEVDKKISQEVKFKTQLAPIDDYLYKVCWHPLVEALLLCSVGSSVMMYAVPVGVGNIPHEGQQLAQVDTATGSMVTSLCFEPQGTLMAGGDEGGGVTVWKMPNESDETEDIQCLASFQSLEEGGGAVNFLEFLPSPSGTSTLLVGTKENSCLSLWTQQVPGSFMCIQTIQLAGASYMDDFFNHVAVTPAYHLVFLADTRNKSLHCLHYDNVEDGVAFDYITSFPVQLPILSFVSDVEDNSNSEELVLLYCCQTEAVQQYAVEAAGCRPDLEGPTFPPASLPVSGAGLQAAGEEVPESGATSLGSDLLATSSPGNTRTTEYLVSSPPVPDGPPQPEAIATVTPTESVSQGEAPPISLPSSVSPSSLPLPLPPMIRTSPGLPADHPPPPCRLLTPQQLLDRSSSYSSQASITSPAARQVRAASQKEGTPTSSAIPNGDLGANSGGPRSGASTTPLPQDYNNIEVGPAASLAGSSVLVSGTLEAGETPGSLGLSASDNPHEEGGGGSLMDKATSSSTMAALQGHMKELHKGLNKRLDEKHNNLVNTVKKTVAEQIRHRDVEQTKSLEQVVVKLLKKGEEESKRRGQTANVEMERLMSGVVTRAVNSGVAEVVREQKAAQSGVLTSVSSRISQSVRETLPGVVSSLEPALASLVQRAVTSQLEELLPRTVAHVFEEQFREVLVPAFEDAIREMMVQTHQKLDTYLRDMEQVWGEATERAAAGLREMVQEVKDSAGQVNGNIERLSTLLDSKSAQLVQDARRAQNQTPGRSSSTVSQHAPSQPARHAVQKVPSSPAPAPTPIPAAVPGPVQTQVPAAAPAGQLPASAAPPAPLHPELDPHHANKSNVAQLLSAHDFEAAFREVLSLQDLSLLTWLLGKVDPNELLKKKPLPLSQVVLLSLLSQLGSDLHCDTDLKLTWIRQAAPMLQLDHETIAAHVRGVLEGLAGALQEQLTRSQGDSVRLCKGALLNVDAMLRMC